MRPGDAHSSRAPLARPAHLADDHRGSARHRPAPALACPGSPDPCPYRAVQQFGTTNGVLQFPEAVAAAPDGSILVPNSFDYHVARFSNAGAFVASYGAPTLSAPPPDGTSNGSLGSAVDPATGNYYILDNDNNRVEEYSPAGAFLHRIGKADGYRGNGIGEFSLKGTVGLTGGITVANGFVRVADGGNARIQRLSLGLTSPVVLSGSSFVGHPTGIQVAGGVLWVTDHESTPNTNRIIRYALSGTTLSAPVTATVPFADPLVYDASATTPSTPRRSASTSSTPRPSTAWPAADPLWPRARPDEQDWDSRSLPVATSSSRRVTTWSSASRRRAPRSGRPASTSGGTGVVLTAEGLSVAANGDTPRRHAGHAADHALHYGRCVRVALGLGVGRPGRVVVSTASVVQAPDGTLWSVNSTSRVIRFGADGSYLGDAAGDLGQAIVLAVDGHGQVDELGLASQVVRRFDAAGTLLGSFGSSGTGPERIEQRPVAGRRRRRNDRDRRCGQSSGRPVLGRRHVRALVRVGRHGAGPVPVRPQRCASTARVICSPSTQGLNRVQE